MFWDENLNEVKSARCLDDLCVMTSVFHICICVTVCIVVQFVSVDQPQRKQRAYRDRSVSRCFSSGSVIAHWLEFPLLCRLQLYAVKATFSSFGLPPADTHNKKQATLVGLALIWEIPLDLAHMLKQHDRRISTAVIYSQGLRLY